MFACNEKCTLLTSENLKDIICVHVSKLLTPPPGVPKLVFLVSKSKPLVAK